MNFKKRLCKTFAVLGACMLLAGAVVSFPATNVSAQAVTSEEKTIDMYLIAGQSNAAGYSSKGRKLDGVFENVSYAGEVDRYRSNGNASQSYLEYPFQSAVKEGLGRASGFVGPEYGIAEKLNEKYKGGHKALVFKSAAGEYKRKPNRRTERRFRKLVFAFPMGRRFCECVLAYGRAVSAFRG